MSYGCFTGLYNELQMENFQKIDSFIDFLENSSGLLEKKEMITVLHQAQRICGYLSRDIKKHIATKFNVSIEEIESVINFYEYFNKVPQAIHSEALLA